MKLTKVQEAAPSFGSLTVVVNVDGRPIPGVQIFIDDSLRGETDSNGRSAIDSLACPGDYTLRVKKEGDVDPGAIAYPLECAETAEFYVVGFAHDPSFLAPVQLRIGSEVDVLRIDGKRIELDRTAFDTTLPIGFHTVTFFSKDLNLLGQKRFYVDSEVENTVWIDYQLSQSGTVRIPVPDGASWAKVTVNGETWENENMAYTPFEGRFVPGKYRFSLVQDASGVRFVPVDTVLTVEAQSQISLRFRAVHPE
jgi:hypothetical protein